MFSVFVSQSKLMGMKGKVSEFLTAGKSIILYFCAFVHFYNCPVVNSRRGVFYKNHFVVFISHLNVQETEQTF